MQQHYLILLFCLICGSLCAQNQTPLNQNNIISTHKIDTIFVYDTIVVPGDTVYLVDTIFQKKPTKEKKEVNFHLSIAPSYETNFIHSSKLDYQNLNTNLTANFQLQRLQNMGINIHFQINHWQLTGWLGIEQMNENILINKSASLKLNTTAIDTITSYFTTKNNDTIWHYLTKSHDTTLTKTQSRTANIYKTKNFTNAGLGIGYVLQWKKIQFIPSIKGTYFFMLNETFQNTTTADLLMMSQNQLTDQIQNHFWQYQLSLTVQYPAIFSKLHIALYGTLNNFINPTANNLPAKNIFGVGFSVHWQLF